MRRLLLLAFIAVASEAMAQEPQCASERAAMVETIRAYARSEADVLGPQVHNGQVRRQLAYRKFANASSSNAAPSPSAQGRLKSAWRGMRKSYRFCLVSNTFFAQT
jgi:hypothetical protein